MSDYEIESASTDDALTIIREMFDHGATHEIGAIKLLGGDVEAIRPVVVVVVLPVPDAMAAAAGPRMAAMLRRQASTFEAEADAAADQILADAGPIPDDVSALDAEALQAERERLARSGEDPERLYDLDDEAERRADDDQGEHELGECCVGGCSICRDPDGDDDEVES